MGKDSKLTQCILNKVTSNYRTIFNNTTLDCSEVYKEAKTTPNIEIVTPKCSNGTNRSFYKMIKLHGTPSRFSRWCCSYFKEGGTDQYLKDKYDLLFFLGMRNDESLGRKNYQFEWKNELWKNKTWVGCLPIRKWKEFELWLYTIHNHITINEKYLKGYSRVGCHIACPYYTKSTWILDKYWYPKQYTRFRNIIREDFIKNEKWTRMNCTIEEYQTAWNGGVVREFPTDNVVEEFMEYKNIDDKQIALQYFNKTCICCNKKVYKKDEIAMNLKYFGRQINKFKCKKCLMKEFGWTKEDWNKQVKKFQEQGCNLF